MLFLSNEHGPHLGYSAYVHRLVKLRSALEQRGIHTEMLSLRDERFGHPILAQALNAPSLRNRAAGFDFIHAGGEAAYTAALLRPWTKARIIHDVHGDVLSEARLTWSATHSPRGAYRVGQALITKLIAFRYVHYFLVVSKPLQKRLTRDMHISAQVIGLVRNGVDINEFSPLRASPSDVFTVCYAGGFQNWRGTVYM